MQVKAFKIRLQEEHLSSDQENINQFLSSVKIKKTSVQLVADHYWSVLAFYEGNVVANEKTEEATVDKQHEKTHSRAEKIFFPPETELTTDEQNLYATLKQWRTEKAQLLGLPSYVVCSNSELLAIAKVRPQLVSQLASLKGFGAQKIAKYGDDIIALLNSVN